MHLKMEFAFVPHIEYTKTVIAECYGKCSRHKSTKCCQVYEKTSTYSIPKMPEITPVILENGNLSIFQIPEMTSELYGNMSTSDKRDCFI